MKPSEKDLEIAREIVESECGKRGLTPLEAQMNLDNLENRIASMRASEREKVWKGAIAAVRAVDADPEIYGFSVDVVIAALEVAAIRANKE